MEVYDVVMDAAATALDWDIPQHALEDVVWTLARALAGIAAEE